MKQLLWCLFAVFLLEGKLLAAKNFVTSDRGKKYYTGLVVPKSFTPPVTRSALTELKKQGISLPATYDLKTLYNLDSAEDQGNCGSCWAFSIAGVFKDVLKINGISRRLSQQYLLNCNTQGYSCQGGFFEPHDLHKSPKGAVNWSDYPYTGQDGSCKSGLTYNEKLISWAYIPGGDRPATDEIKAAIYAHGTVAVGIAASQSMSNYSGGVWAGDGSTQLNHAVNLVGWGDGYWILKNSWGTSWGENGGYMRIKFGANIVGAQANYIVYGSGPSPDPSPNPDPTPGPNPDPDPTPSPDPTPPPCPPPVAKTGYPAEVSIRMGSTLYMGTKAVSGVSYKWTAQPPFNGNGTPKEAIIRFTPSSTKTVTIYATNKCGTAQATTKVNVLAFDGYKVNVGPELKKK